MTHVVMNQPAPVGGTFASDAFASQVGKSVPLNVGSSHTPTCTIVAVNVADDGSHVELTLEVPDSVAQVIQSNSNGFSLR